jgi:hypothetical protein
MRATVVFGPLDIHILCVFREPDVFVGILDVVPPVILHLETEDVLIETFIDDTSLVNIVTRSILPFKCFSAV